MIKTCYFILLLILNGSISTLADEDDALDNEDSSLMESKRNCYTRLREECHSDSFPDDIPKTADEILNICGLVSEIGRCTIKVDEDCDTHDRELIAHIRSAVNYIDTTCQIGNPTFEEIAGNIECVIEALNVSEKICQVHEYSKETKELVISRVLSFVEEALHISKDDLHCVDRLFKLGCPAITVGIHCGSEPRKAVYEILDQIEYYGHKCEDEVMNEIEPLLDLFEEVIIERLDEENAIGDQK